MNKYRYIPKPSDRYSVESKLRVDKNKFSP